MFRRFSLFDSSPPPSRISINPPRASAKGDRKSTLKSAIINSLQMQNSPAILLKSHPEAKRSKSLDQAANLRIVQSQRTKSATLPPIINRQLPQASPTSGRWFSRLGNSIRRGAWRRPPFQYQVNNSSGDFITNARIRFTVKFLVCVLHSDPLNSLQMISAGWALCQLFHPKLGRFMSDALKNENSFRANWKINQIF